MKKALSLALALALTGDPASVRAAADNLRPGNPGKTFGPAGIGPDAASEISKVDSPLELSPLKPSPEAELPGLSPAVPAEPLSAAMPLALPEFLRASSREDKRTYSGPLPPAADPKELPQKLAANISELVSNGQWAAVQAKLSAWMDGTQLRPADGLFLIPQLVIPEFPPAPRRFDAGAPLGRAIELGPGGIEVVTNIGLGYRAQKWGPRRIVLDAVSNHLPADSGGTRVSARVKQDGRWLDLLEAREDRPIEEAVFEDDGAGYDFKHLLLLFSSKEDDSASVGQFGEGLKLIAAAALRHGADIEFRSRDWSARPFIETTLIDGNPYAKLGFRIMPAVQRISGSRTLLRGLSPKTAKEVLLLRENVLALNPAHRTVDSILLDPGLRPARAMGRLRTLLRRLLFWRNSPAPVPARVVDRGLERRALFIKGVHVRDIDAAFDYDLGLEGVTPDRDVTDYEGPLLEAIRSVLHGTSSEELSRAVIARANASPNKDFLEHRALNANLPHLHPDDTPQLPHEPGNPWLRAFLGLYGNNAVLAASGDSEQDEEANLMGYKVVVVNNSLKQFLASERIGVPTVEGLRLGKSEHYDWSRPETLSGKERRALASIRRRLGRLAALHRLDDEFPKNFVPELAAYDGVYSAAGRKIETNPAVYIPGAHDGRGRIGLERTLLAPKSDLDPLDAAVHEFGHHASGQADNSPGFTDYFTTILARILLRSPQLGLTSPKRPETISEDAGQTAQSRVPARRTAWEAAPIDRSSAQARVTQRTLSRPRFPGRALRLARRPWSWMLRLVGGTWRSIKLSVWRARRRRILMREDSLLTMITLAYRRKKWGLERIVLDALSNHLPADSGGTRVRVDILQGGQWVGFDEADPSAPAKTVVFEDDGVGYDSARLSLLDSDKQADALSVGQFGEGLKLVSAAAMREGVDIEFRSRDWAVRPYTVLDSVGGHPVERLAFSMRKGLPLIRGSRTLIHDPSPKLFSEILALPRKALVFGRYRPIYREAPEPFSQRYLSRAVDLGRPEASLFVKGVRVRSVHALFDWDLGLDNVVPDRDLVDDSKILHEAVGRIMAAALSRELAAGVLIAAEAEPFEPFLEFAALDSIKGTVHVEPVWREIFSQLFESDGQPAVLAEPRDSVLNTQAAALGYRVVHLNSGVTNFLNSWRVNLPTSKDVVRSGKPRYLWSNSRGLSSAEALSLKLARQAIQLSGGQASRPRPFDAAFTAAGYPIDPDDLGQGNITALKGVLPIKRGALASPEAAVKAALSAWAQTMTRQHSTSRKVVDFLTKQIAARLKLYNQDDNSRGPKKGGSPL